MNQISSDREHKYFHPDYLFATVYLDDVKQTFCITADADEGWIELYHVVDGKVQFNPSGDAERQILRGKVRIEMRVPEFDAELHEECMSKASQRLPDGGTKQVQALGNNFYNSRMLAKEKRET